MLRMLDQRTQRLDPALRRVRSLKDQDLLGCEQPAAEERLPEIRRVAEDADQHEDLIVPHGEMVEADQPEPGHEREKDHDRASKTEPGRDSRTRTINASDEEPRTRDRKTESGSGGTSPAQGYATPERLA
jgi:hypothetical protein